jgi:hypothetical protein
LKLLMLYLSFGFWDFAQNDGRGARAKVKGKAKAGSRDWIPGRARDDI